MGKPKYILLVRHGESEGNCDKTVNRYTPNHRVALTETGHSQAKAAGLVLREFLLQEHLYKGKCENARSILFYTSPYTRARQTCNDIIKGIKNLPGVSYSVREEPKMREQDFGNFQSTPEEMEQIWEERAHYGHFFYRIPHGESAADVYDRISSFNETLYRQFRSEDFPNILVLVTHGIWARVFLMKWFRWSYEEFESLRNIPHCQYLIMKREGNGKFHLKTPLKTWDDLLDGDIDEEVEREIGDEVTFNTKNKLANMDDLDISGILRAQKDAIKSTRDKDKRIKETFFHLAGKSREPNELAIDKFENDNQSALSSDVNSRESFFVD